MPKNQASGAHRSTAPNWRPEADRLQPSRSARQPDRVPSRFVDDRRDPERRREFELTGRIPRAELTQNTQRFSPRELEMYEAHRRQALSDTRRMSDTQRMGGARAPGDSRRMSDTQRMGVQRETRRGNTQRTGMQDIGRQPTQRTGVQDIGRQPSQRTQRTGMQGIERTQRLPQQTRMNTTVRISPEQAARHELKTTRLAKGMMYVTCALLMVLMFVQIGRLAQIAAQTKQIASINANLREMDIEKNNLEVRLSMQQNINRVKDEAINKLGMVYPADGQIRVVALGQSTPSRTQTADGSGILGGTE